MLVEPNGSADRRNPRDGEIRRARGSEWEAAGFAEKEDDWFFFAWDDEEDE